MRHQRRSPRLIKYGYNTLTIWVIALILSAPIGFYQKVVEFGLRDLVLYDKCVESWPNNNRGIYSFVILITQLLIPSSVMLVSHYRIRGHLNRHRFVRNQRSQFQQKRQSSNTSLRSNTNTQPNNAEEIQRLVLYPALNSLDYTCPVKPIVQ